MAMSFRCTIVIIFVTKWRHNFSKIVVKSCENSKKNYGKVCVHHFKKIAERFKKVPSQ